MNILGIIPARGGSKSIPRKNLAELAGKPLLFYTADCAIRSKLLTRIILNTDDIEIAETGQGYGLEVPFLRPSDLADDVSPMLSVLRHTLTWFDQLNYIIDILVILQPTSPYRLPHHIDEAVTLLIENGADSVVSVVQVPHRYSPKSLMKLIDGKLLPYLEDDTQAYRRQDKPTLFARNGPAVLAIRPDIVVDGRLYTKNTLPYLMDPICSVDIDDPGDLVIASYLYPLWLDYQNGMKAKQKNEE